MLRFNTLFVTLFVFLLTFCVGTIHIVEAHTELESAKSDYSVLAIVFFPVDRRLCRP